MSYSHSHSCQIPSSRPCRTCGQTHPQIPGTYSTDCILLGARARSLGSPPSSRHGFPSTFTSTLTPTLKPAFPEDRYTCTSNSTSFPPSHLLTTIPIPLNDIRSQALLFDQIWFWFIDMKRENDDLRDSLSRLSMGHKGTLKGMAPLLWLEWRFGEDMRGQTRNQENWEGVWRRLIGVDGQGQKGHVPVAWITLRRMERDGSGLSLEGMRDGSPEILKRGIVT